MTDKMKEYQIDVTISFNDSIHLGVDEGENLEKRLKDFITIYYGLSDFTFKINKKELIEDKPYTAGQKITTKEMNNENNN